MNPRPFERPNALDLVVSWAAFALLVAVAAALGWYAPWYRSAVQEVYVDFGVRVSPAIETSLRVPTAVIAGVCGLVAFGGVAVQAFGRSKKSATLFHLLGVFVLVVGFLVYRETLGNPLLQLVQGMSGGAPAR